ncbi:MAG: hypothetical protein D6775_11825 [Caldilineae bacterium]|nr:MAG: hypothetical protein D6775_11825 [Caldilineae bacterium]
MIRTFSLRDCLRLQRLSRHSIPLQLEYDLTQPQPPLWAAVGAPLPWHGTGAATYFLLPGDRQQLPPAFIQAIKRPARPEADITRIAPAHSEDPAVQDAWLRLLEHTVCEAGEHDIQRLYVCLSSDDPAVATISAAGFAPYIQETLYRLPSPPALDEHHPDEWPNVRPQREVDSFAIQRLHSRNTPQIVQQAEGTLVNNGDALSPLHLRTWWQPEHIEGFVYEEKGDVRAAAHIKRGSKGHWLRLYGGADAVEALEAVLKRSLQALAYYSQRPIYCALRPYQSHLGPLLMEHGFEPGPILTRFVKHTTSAVRKAATVKETADATLPRLIPTEFGLEPPSRDTI